MFKINSRNAVIVNLVSLLLTLNMYSLVWFFFVLICFVFYFLDARSGSFIQCVHKIFRRTNCFLPHLLPLCVRTKRVTQNQNDLQCENPVKFSPSVRLFALSFVQLPLYPFVRDFLSENTVRNFLIRFIKLRFLLT